MSNRKIGNTFEQEFCDLLSEKGFWVHNLAQNAFGQPADVIAVKKKKAYLIDCKECSSNKFDLTRIEENQALSMELWNACGNGEGWFAIKMQGKIIMVSYDVMKFCEGYKTLSFQKLWEYGAPINLWLEKK